MNKTPGWLKEQADRVHILNKDWWINIETGAAIDRNIGELLMLTVSELAEAMEGHRKSLNDDKLPQRKMFEVELADAVIRIFDIMGGLHLEIRDRRNFHFNLTENVAECLLKITILVTRAYNDRAIPGLFCLWLEHTLYAIDELAEREKLDLWSAYEEKLTYNKTRADHQIEQRLKADGKKY